METTPGGIIVTGSYDSSVKVWDISKLIRKLELDADIVDEGTVTTRPEIS